ncbi:hypothetical protein [Mycolicibacterium stellerae]|uniref:hypothetical protein n=1 Tax=Mycolicibacterium stellerae TaxID=2358193 RepID=UPI0019D2FF63|nr:hypothetical protein [Mycolicibacterium stellerae]
MPALPATTAARLRGIASGLLTAALAVAAHGAGDGAAPSGTAVVLLAVLAATMGGLAATISRTADVRVLLGLLASGQLIGHLLLATAGHSHGEPESITPAMLAGHALAVIVGALLIAAGDRLCRAVSRVATVAARAVVTPIPSRQAVVVGADQPLRSALLLAASVSHRGPPVRQVR